jgi:pimeloyl-ACP methyl ester carboxylesterase/membrane protein DedA with SNARE-associated domain
LTITRTILLVWLLALALSTVWIALQPLLSSGNTARPADANGFTRVIDVGNGGNGGNAQREELVFREWSPTDAKTHLAPVVLLHGSPGRGADLSGLAEELQRRSPGRRILVCDLPGFGQTQGPVASLSNRSHARAVGRWLDELRIDGPVHLVGFSMGGGVILRFQDMHPDRVASLTLLSAIGIQRGEGSGNYHIEHAKYALAYLGLVGLPRLIPHFGLIPGERGRWAFTRNFWDTDQRGLDRVLKELGPTPLLILHGKRDFLVPPEAARAHAQLAGNSRLEWFDGMHFMVFNENGLLAPVAERLNHFLDEAEGPSGDAIARAEIDHGGAWPAAEGAASTLPIQATMLLGLQPDHSPSTFRQQPWQSGLWLAAGASLPESFTTIHAATWVSALHLDGVWAMACLWLGALVGQTIAFLIGRAGMETWPEGSDSVAKRPGQRRRIWLSRFLPGLHLPLAWALGRRGCPFPRWLLWSAIAGALYWPVAIGLVGALSPLLAPLWLWCTILSLGISVLACLLLARRPSPEHTAAAKAVKRGPA